MFVSSIDDSRHGMHSVLVNNVLRKVVPESKRCMAIEASLNHSLTFHISCFSTHPSCPVALLQMQRQQTLAADGMPAHDEVPARGALPNLSA